MGGRGSTGRVAAVAPSITPPSATPTRARSVGDLAQIARGLENSAGVVKVIDLYDASGMPMDEFADMLRAGRRNDVWVVYEHAYSGDLTARERRLPVIGGNQMHRLELL
jgi:hypothetical protein